MGTLNSGKSFPIRYMVYDLITSNKSIILIASAWAAATQLSSLASKVHHQFKISTAKSQQYPLSIPLTDIWFLATKEADAIIINEISILTRMTFDMVVWQIVNITDGTMLDPFSNKPLLLFGDLAQLPPVCKYSANLCLSCADKLGPFSTL